MMKKKKTNNIYNEKGFDTIVFIILLLLLIITAYPLYFVIIASFSDPAQVVNGSVILLPKGFTLEGYKKVIEYERLWVGYRNTIVYTLGHTAIATAVTLLAGYALSRKKLAGRRGITFFMAFTMYFSGGMIPSYLMIKNMGFQGRPELYILLGTISVYNIIIARTFMENTIPEDLVEAASIDGCNTTKFFFKVALPLSPALIAILVLFFAVGHWNSWFNAMLYLKDDQMPLQNVLRNILATSQLTFETGTNSMIGSSDYDSQSLMVESMRYAVIIVSTLPIMCLYPFVQKYFVKGIMVGAIKG